MPTNPNYEETDEGSFRKPDAPDAKHKSRINWSRAQSLEQIRQGVAEQRRIQNERNEAYRRSHGNG